MDTRFSIRLCVPQDKNMSGDQLNVVAQIRKRLDSEGLRVELDGHDSHRLQDRYENIRRCHGVLVLALAQWNAQRLYRDKETAFVTPSEFAHVGNSMAAAAGKPILVLREKNVAPRGSLKEGYVHPVVTMPHKPKPEWLLTSDFRDAFDEWLRKVREHRHVFLGYSSEAKPMADLVGRYLKEKLKLSVLDWHDFPAGGVIMQNIAEAERLSNCGLFLFTNDDKIRSKIPGKGVPRDNVVFEAGYFTGAKGPRFTLIIREEGAKVPTDLGGVVYLEVKRRTNISSIEGQLQQYFESRL